MTLITTGSSQASVLGKKIAILAIIFVAANIPRWMLASLNAEREVYYRQAIDKIVEGFASPVAIGPKSLELTFVAVAPTKGKVKDMPLPSKVEMPPTKSATTLNFEFQERRKGIFRVPVFVAGATSTGSFRIDWNDARRSAFGSEAAKIGDMTLAASTLKFTIDDAKRLTAFNLTVNGKPIQLRRTSEGVEARLTPQDLGVTDMKGPLTIAYAFAFGIRGFREIAFKPSADEETLDLESPWRDPAFEHALPTDYQVDDSGTKARWSFVGGTTQPALVRFYEPGTVYQLSERSRKYGSFIIVFLLVAFFLYEILGPLRLHFIHYLFLTLPVSLFFLLLLAVSEHAGFGPAYVISSSAVVLLMTGYLRGIGLKTSAATSFGALKAGLFAMIYVILESTDYALLLGAVALFLILGGAMFMTRKVDWEALDGTRTKIA